MKTILSETEGAGFSPATEDITTTFVTRMENDSMINAFIPKRAWLVIDPAVTANNGDIVMAAVNGKWAIRYLKRNSHYCWLCPANKTYEPIKILPEMNLIIKGVVIQIVIHPADLKMEYTNW